MWISKNEWQAILRELLNVEALVGKIRVIARGKKLNVTEFYFGCDKPQKVEVLLSLSYHEWSEIEKSDAWEKVKRLFLE
ncbi:hypothetical protein NIA71_19630 [Ihubacter massiliensis]|uniref:hypothetical protein n=1 Tax=Anaerovoracaceae TaxID=543314 RepID=UPI0011DDFB2F|nr:MULTISPECIES: hypothetical protein [Eubacteriales Family XIII. Incertae Sedis]MCI7302540.1 hypothetical protein [Clostridia bacterium]MCO7124132.1 hypothetical protein [Ihubacter massiliensis]MDY3011420.1 hypothetical protein [Clostridiales Family XIII bacterium]